MASKYQMRKGYVAEFSIPFKGIKAFTNGQITDELAEEYLKRHPERAVYFTVRPTTPNKPVVPPGLKVVKPKVDVPKKEEKPVDLIGETMKAVTGEPKKEPEKVEVNDDLGNAKEPDKTPVKKKPVAKKTVKPKT